MPASARSRLLLAAILSVLAALIALTLPAPAAHARV